MVGECTPGFFFAFGIIPIRFDKVEPVAVIVRLWKTFQMKHRRFVCQQVLLSTSLPQCGGFGLLTSPTRDCFWKRLRSKESVSKVRSTGDGDPPSSCPCYPDIERAGASQGSRVVSANTNLNLRFGVIAACTFRTSSTDGMILVRILNPFFEDVRIPSPHYSWSVVSPAQADCDH